MLSIYHYQNFNQINYIQDVLFIIYKRISFKHLNFFYFKQLYQERYLIIKELVYNILYIESIDKNDNMKIFLLDYIS